jgi:hypothetical protein
MSPVINDGSTTGGANLYEFAYNASTNLVDPDGRDSMAVIGFPPVSSVGPFKPQPPIRSSSRKERYGCTQGIVST